VLIHLSMELQSNVLHVFSASINGTGAMSDTTAWLQETVMGTNTMGSQVTHNINPADGDSLQSPYLHGWLPKKTSLLWGVLYKTITSSRPTLYRSIYLVLAYNYFCQFALFFLQIKSICDTKSLMKFYYAKLSSAEICTLP
jgi:hypothetical protein